MSNPFDDSFQGDNGPTVGPPNPFDADDALASSSDVVSTNDLDEDEYAAVESTWKYLKDLPYRQIPIYSNVLWELDPEDEDWFAYGLERYPSSALNPSWPRSERMTLLRKTTTTKVSGCPYGGPLASITTPVMSTPTFAKTQITIWTNAGKVLTRIPFPPQSHANYSPSLITTIGFTSRAQLVVVLQDSLCLTYNLRGEPILAPFFILQQPSQGKAISVTQAVVFAGGVAVLAQNQSCALVELLDEHDNLSYSASAPLSARKVTFDTNQHTDVTSSADGIFALVTPLETAEFSRAHGLSYLTLAVLPRHCTSHGHPEVFISTICHSVVVVEARDGSMTDLDCRARMVAPLTHMAFAPNGRFLACFTTSGVLTVVSTDFDVMVLDFDASHSRETSSSSSQPPLDMQWCGEDSVVLHFKNLGVLMVGPYGDWLRFPYNDTSDQVYLVPEADGCRVVTESRVEMLQRVPQATALILRMGSIEPAAILLDAADAFYSKSTVTVLNSDEMVQGMVEQGTLNAAITSCFEAATNEFDIFTQKRLLRAASFGMHISDKKQVNEERMIVGGSTTISEAEQDGEDCENQDPYSLPSRVTRRFVENSRKLRVLNALRHPLVGVVMTFPQWQSIGAIGVVGRLVAMNRPELATSICDYLALPKSIQLFARASKASSFVEQKAQADEHLSDSEIAQGAIMIITKEVVSSAVSPGASASMFRGAYATVALAANKVNKPGVANLLLMLESSVADKVPALIAGGSYADAIAVATTARDADFIFSTLMDFERNCMIAASPTDLSQAQSAFLSTVVGKFTLEAFHTLRRYLRSTSDIQRVLNLLLRGQKFSWAGREMAQKALVEVDVREKQGMLAEASRIFGISKETAFQKSCTDDYLDLRKDQEVLRNKYGSVDVAPESSSVTATISSIVKFAASNIREQHRLLADADKVAKKFRVAEKRLWHIKVIAFAASEQWSNLRILADSRAKPPIGYKPFARAVIDGNQNSSEILRYTERISDLEERYDMLCYGQLWSNALDEAFKMKDTRRILNVKNLCNSADIQIKADQLMGRLA